MGPLNSTALQKPVFMNTYVLVNGNDRFTVVIDSIKKEPNNKIDPI